MVTLCCVFAFCLLRRTLPVRHTPGFCTRFNQGLAAHPRESSFAAQLHSHPQASRLHSIGTHCLLV
jgi:hypothetical protein